MLIFTWNLAHILFATYKFQINNIFDDVGKKIKKFVQPCVFF